MKNVIFVLICVFLIETTGSAHGGGGGGGGGGGHGGGGHGGGGHGRRGNFRLDEELRRRNQSQRNQNQGNQNHHVGGSNQGGPAGNGGICGGSIDFCGRAAPQNNGDSPGTPPVVLPQGGYAHLDRHQHRRHAPPSYSKVPPQVVNIPRPPNLTQQEAEHRTRLEKNTADITREAEANAACFKIMVDEIARYKAERDGLKNRAAEAQAQADQHDRDAEAIEVDSRNLQATIDHLNFDDFSSITEQDLALLFQLDSEMRSVYEELRGQIQGMQQEIAGQAHVSRADMQARIERLQETQRQIGGTDQTRYEYVTNVDYAQNRQTEVNRLAGTILNETLPRVTAQMEQAASEYIREQVQGSQAIAQSAVELAQEGQAQSTIRLLSDFALNTVNSVNAFLGGVAGGLYDGFLTVAQVGEAIYNDPDLILNLSTHIMNAITAGPGSVSDEVRHAFQSVEHAVYTFYVTMAHGNASERGHALGELASNMLVSSATANLAHVPIAAVRATIQNAVVGIAGSLTSTGASRALGATLDRAMRSSEALTPEMARIDSAVREIGDSARQRIGNSPVHEIAGQRVNAPRPTQGAVNPDIVRQYVERMRNGERIEPIEIVRTPGGDYIVEGHHRYIAGQALGQEVPSNITEGSGPVGLPNWGDVRWEDFIPR